MSRYTINVQLVEIDDDGNMVGVVEESWMDVATTDREAFVAVNFSVACEWHVGKLLEWGMVKEESLSETVPGQSAKLPHLLALIKDFHS